VRGLAGLAVRHVGGAQGVESGLEVVESAAVEFFEVEEVAGVLLHRPAFAVAPGEQFRRDAARQIFEPRGRAAHAL
jgi:hypothetical protein